MRRSIDDHELDILELDLRGGPLRIKGNARAALTRGAARIDREMTVDAAGHQGNLFGRVGTEFDTGLEKHVSHELIDPWTAEIGIEKGGAGSLAHIIVYGSANNAPVYDHMAGPRRAMPAVERDFADAAEESVFGRRGQA